MHQVIDLSRFLNILGPQTIQLTIRYNHRPITSYIMKTTRNTVEYIRIISGKQGNATINFDLNFNEENFNGHSKPRSQLIKDVIQNYMYQVAKTLANGNLRETLDVLKFTLATSLEAVSTLSSKLF